MNGKKLLAVLFAVILMALPLITAFSKKEKTSEWENRDLATFPGFSTEAIMDKSFMEGFDSYISDHFFGRNFWVKLKSNLELLTLKRENNSILLTTKGTLVEDLDEPNERYINQNIDGILSFAKNNPDAKIYTAVAPTSCDLYSDTLPYGKKVWSQKEQIDSFYSNLGKSVYGIDIYSTLYAKRDQYIYYNTDHHWTSLGAYYAYHQIATALDFKPYEKTQFDIEHASNEFYGTYSSKSNISVDPDTIDLYYSHASSDFKITEVSINNGKETKVYNDIYFREWLSKKDKYSVFLGQVQPEVTIKTNVQNNKKLLIFKDSFAHSLVPFLSLHYSEIKLIDLRYTNQNYRDLADIASYDSVLLLYNIDSVVGSGNIAALGD
ncbi:MAG: DHHW family protein [Oscillospiraceae bacterium]|nr:DHHW family protein [Oscillospiraceae bacterium]